MRKTIILGTIILVMGIISFSSQAGAQTLVTIQQSVGYSGSGSAHNEAGDNFNINIIKWPHRGLGVSEYAWLYFGRIATSDQLLVNGWGNVPVDAVSISAEFVAVDLPDVSSIPDFYLVCMNMSTWQNQECPSPIALHVKVEAARTSLWETVGVQRQEYTNADGSIWKITKSGASSNIAAMVRGNIAGLNVPIANPLWSEGSVSSNRGVTITIERIP